MASWPAQCHSSSTTTSPKLMLSRPRKPTLSSGKSTRLRLTLRHAFLYPYGHAFAVPAALARAAGKDGWRTRCWQALSAMIIDIDHLLADPILDPNRCSVGFHRSIPSGPQHSMQCSHLSRQHAGLGSDSSSISSSIASIAPGCSGRSEICDQLVIVKDLSEVISVGPTG